MCYSQRYCILCNISIAKYVFLTIVFLFWCILCYRSSFLFFCDLTFSITLIHSEDSYRPLIINSFQFNKYVFLFDCFFYGHRVVSNLFVLVSKGDHFLSTYWRLLVSNFFYFWLFDLLIRSLFLSFFIFFYFLCLDVYFFFKSLEWSISCIIFEWIFFHIFVPFSRLYRIFSFFLLSSYLSSVFFLIFSDIKKKKWLKFTHNYLFFEKYFCLFFSLFHSFFCFFIAHFLAIIFTLKVLVVKLFQRLLFCLFFIEFFLPDTLIIKLIFFLNL